MADVGQVTLEIKTNPPKKEKNADNATAKGSNAIINGTATSGSQEPPI